MGAEPGTKQFIQHKFREAAKQPSHRILVGITEVAGQINDFADGFRQLGHEATSVIGTPHSFYNELSYDVTLGANVINWTGGLINQSPLRLLPKSLNRSARLAGLLRLIAQHDIFVFIWAGDSLRGSSDVRLIKKLGKKIVWIFCGDDVRHPSAYGQEFSSMVLSADHQERLHNDPLTRPLQGLRLSERYSDLIISQPNQSSLAVRPYNHFFVPVRLSQLVCRTPGRQAPVVVHAPSVKSVKGTEFILPVLKRLAEEGVSHELRLIQGASNKEVLAALADADVVIDQLHFPLHGKLGVEAMASGCALATCNREDYEPFPPGRPIWHIDPENLYPQLRLLLTDRELRLRLAAEGRTYVERYHDHIKAAGRIMDALSDNNSHQYDHYPTFFARSYQLPDSVTIPDNLKRITGEIIQRWGLPEDVDPNDMIRRGLMSAEGLHPSRPIPRWTGQLAGQKTPLVSHGPV